MSTRDAAVAGFFYPGVREELLAEVDRCLEGDLPRERASMVVLPHAGYVFSGRIAGRTLSRVEVPERVVLLGPKHRAAGAALALSADDAWRLPSGDVPIDQELSGIVERETAAVFDDAAHRDEHSLEVEVPLLWRSNPDLRLTPLAVGMIRADDVLELGRGLARAVRSLDEPVLLAASTDMSHHIPEAEARRLDRLAIDKILELDPGGLIEVVAERGITMCGVLPTAAALQAARELGASAAELVDYTTSGEYNRDFDRVVGYAGIVVE